MAQNWPYVINLSNSIIGISTLAMPFCFKQCGILLGILLLLLSTWLTLVSCQILMKAGVTSRRSSYGFLAYYTYGVSGKLAVELGMIGLQIGTLIAQIVVIGDFGPIILAKIFGIPSSSNLRTGLIMFLCLGVGLPLGLLKDLRAVSRASTICVCFYVVFILYVLGLSAPNLLTGAWYPKVHFWKADGLFETLPIFSFSFGCQTQLFILYDALPEPSLKTVNGITSSAINLCAVAYLLMGFFGYIAFHEDVITGDIIKLFPNTLFADIMKLGFVISTAITIPLIIFPCRVSLYNLLFSQTLIDQDMESAESMVHKAKVHEDDIPQQIHIPEIHFKVLTLLIVLGPMIVGILVPNVEFILGFNGATMGTLMCFVFPAMFFLKVNKGESRGIAQIVLVCGLTIMLVSTFAILTSKKHEHGANGEVKDTVKQIVEDLNLPEIKIENTQKKGEVDQDDKRKEPVEPLAPDDDKPVDKEKPEKKVIVKKREDKGNDEVVQEKEAAVKEVEGEKKNDGIEEKLIEKEKEMEKAEIKQKDLLKKLEKQQEESKKILEAQKELMEELKQHKDEHEEKVEKQIDAAQNPVLNNAGAQNPVLNNAGAQNLNNAGAQNLNNAGAQNLNNAGAQNPVVNNAGAQNPGLNNAGAQNLNNAGAQNPVVNNAGAQNPVLNNAGALNPVLNNAGAQNPVVNNAGVQSPVLNNAGAQNPVLNNAGVQNPVVNNAGAQNPVLNNAGAQNPVLNNAGAQNPILNNAGAQNLNNAGAQNPVLNNVGAQNLNNDGAQNPVLNNAGAQNLNNAGAQNAVLNNAGAQNLGLNNAGAQNLNNAGAQNAVLNNAGAQNPGLNNAGAQNLNNAGAQNLVLNNAGAQNPGAQNLNNAGAQNPGLNNAGAQNSVLNNAGAQNPALNNAGAQNPVLNNAGAQNPVLNNAGAQNPVLNNAGAQNPVLNNAGALNPVLNQNPVVNNAGAKNPVVNNAGAENLLANNAGLKNIGVNQMVQNPVKDVNYIQNQKIVPNDNQVLKNSENSQKQYKRAVVESPVDSDLKNVEMRRKLRSLGENDVRVLSRTLMEVKISEEKNKT